MIAILDLLDSYKTELFVPAIFYSSLNLREGNWFFILICNKIKLFLIEMSCAAGEIINI